MFEVVIKAETANDAMLFPHGARLLIRGEDRPKKAPTYILVKLQGWCRVNLGPTSNLILPEMQWRFSRAFGADRFLFRREADLMAFILAFHGERFK